jgi:DNA-directed RNA polymerase specialized sigma24 family protein
MNKLQEDAILSLYKETFPDLARMVRRMGGTLEEAKDSFHDALLVYIEKEKAGTLQLHSTPKAYLLGIARVMWLRSRGKASLSPLADGYDPADLPDTDTEEQEQSLLKGIIHSGRKCLELLKAFYYDHFSMDEIAGKFGYNGRRSATVQKYKCLEKVRENIKQAHTYAK